MPKHRNARSEPDERIRAARAKNLMHRDGLALRAAAHEARVSARAVLKWFPESVVRDASGRFIAIPDRQIFRMQFVAKQFGLVEGDVRGSNKRLLVGAQWGAINALLDPRIADAGPLLALRGQRVLGVELESDPRVIEHLFLAGMLDFVIVYVEDV